MSGTLTPIETVYNGYRFRSRLEARWAVFFDALGVKYEYEPEGYKLSDGTKYLPDFYLPQTDTFVEIKGVTTFNEMKPYDRHKIEQFIEDSGKPFVIGYDRLRFQACSCEGPELYQLDAPSSSGLIKCRNCGACYFASYNGCVFCRACGHEGIGSDYQYHDGIIMMEGDGTFGLISPQNEIAKFAFSRAMQASFEHGETPRIAGGK